MVSLPKPTFGRKMFISANIYVLVEWMDWKHLSSLGFVRTRGVSDIRDVNQNSNSWAVVKAALVAGMYPNLVHINQETTLPSSNREKKVHFHPTSILNHSQLKEVGRNHSTKLYWHGNKTFTLPKWVKIMNINTCDKDWKLQSYSLSLHC